MIGQFNHPIEEKVQQGFDKADMAKRHFTVANVVGLVENDKLDEFCFDGSDDKVSNLEL